MFPRLEEVKHVACSRCRERKVKCDGGKPACRRCQRLGHECQYIQRKKQRGKGEWVQHLGMFNAQPGKYPQLVDITKERTNVSLIGKTAPATTFPNQRHESKLSKNAQPNPTVQVSDAESAFQYSRSSSPYPVLSSSRPESMVFDAESPFSNSDSTDTWMPPVSTSAPILLGNEVLDPQMFTFSPLQIWRDTNYTSDLITTHPEEVSSGNGWVVQGEHSCGGNEYTALDP
jgi:hypothetical protein